MILDTLTQWVVLWGIATAVAVVAITACKGCCIAKFLGKPCSTK